MAYPLGILNQEVAGKEAGRMCPVDSVKSLDSPCSGGHANPRHSDRWILVSKLYNVVVGIHLIKERGHVVCC